MAAAVLSGNRNFEGRINPLVKANYLASPPLVVAYALAGTTDIDLATEPLGTGSDGQAGLSRATSGRRRGGRTTAVDTRVLPEMFREPIRQRVRRRTRRGTRSPVGEGELFEWDADEHVHPGAAVPGRPGRRAGPDPADPRRPGAGGAGRFGDDRPHLAGRLDRRRQSGRASTCMEHGVEPVDFNSYGARRGNDRVMTRGTFANIRIRNLLAPGTEGGVTRHLPDGEVDDDLRRRDEVQARKACRWSCWPAPNTAPAAAATGPPRARYLLGVRAVIAASFERIHRSNLVGMGVLPLRVARRADRGNRSA